jgi:hypothetical protein
VATNQSLDLFGAVVGFGDGASLPAGRYRVSYVDGCMKYASNQGWTIHAYADGHVAWWLVATLDPAQAVAKEIVMPPGTVGIFPGTGSLGGGFDTFDACVAANHLLPPVEFDHAGGPIGIFVLDNNYGDNLAGEGGRNPKWSLTRLAACGS